MTKCLLWVVLWVGGLAWNQNSGAYISSPHHLPLVRGSHSFFSEREANVSVPWLRKATRNEAPEHTMRVKLSSGMLGNYYYASCFPSVRKWVSTISPLWSPAVWLAELLRWWSGHKLSYQRHVYSHMALRCVPPQASAASDWVCVAGPGSSCEVAMPSKEGRHFLLLCIWQKWCLHLVFSEKKILPLLWGKKKYFPTDLTWYQIYWGNHCRDFFIPFSECTYSVNSEPLKPKACLLWSLPCLRQKLLVRTLETPASHYYCHVLELHRFIIFRENGKHRWVSWLTRMRGTSFRGRTSHSDLLCCPLHPGRWERKDCGLLSLEAKHHHVFETVFIILLKRSHPSVSSLLLARR